MGQKIVQVDAFTDRPFAGNPAATCLLESARSEEWMQAVALEMNLAETAFLVRRNDSVGANGAEYDLRWFTPLVEVDLCGHATLASAHVLWEDGHVPTATPLHFHTRSGVLTAQRKDGLIELDFPAEPAQPTPPPPELLEGLGVTPLWTGRNRMDWLVELDSPAHVFALKPDLNLLKEIPCRGIIVTSGIAPEAEGSDDPRLNGKDFVSRFFGPAAGVDEDFVTGSAHCCLGPYWAVRLGKTEMMAYQASRRGGIVQVRVEGERVKLGGQAITTLRGELSAAATANFA